MAKVAFLVEFAPRTRVVADVENPENLTEGEFAKIAEIARDRISKDCSYYCDENVDIFKDDECPYTPEYDD